MRQCKTFQEREDYFMFCIQKELPQAIQSQPERNVILWTLSEYQVSRSLHALGKVHTIGFLSASPRTQKYVVLMHIPHSSLSYLLCSCLIPLLVVFSFFFHQSDCDQYIVIAADTKLSTFSSLHIVLFQVCVF